jgi:signal transduction histidine kinase
VRLRRPKPLLAAFAVSVLAAVAVMLTLDLWWRHERALANAERRAAGLAAALAESMRSTFALADASLRQLEIHGRRVGGPRAPAGEWLPILQAAGVALPGNGSVSVTDADGVITHSTLESLVGQSRRDTYVYRHLAANDVDEMVLDEPFASAKYPGQYLLPVGRRLETPDGKFDGLVVAVMLPAAFQAVLDTLDVGTTGVIEVFHRSGVVIFRQPSPTSAIGQPAADHPLVQAALAGRGTGRARGPLVAGGPRYISAYRAQPASPFIVAVSLDERASLADWRAQRRTASLGFALFTATLLGLVALVFRQIDARLHAEQALADAQRSEAARLREANDRLEAALDRERHARADAESASRLKDEFLMTLSHELRTPLNAILGWARMLTGDALSADQRARALETIERNARTQTRLVEDLLDVSGAMTGKLQLQVRPVAVADSVRAAVETLRPALSGKGLALEQRIADPLPPVMADPDRLQQVIWNLLANAIKFTPRGGRIRVSVERAGDGIEIRVDDTGQGIDPGFLPFVFDRFRQADGGTQRETSGLGLGLAIARHLVELHGGTLTAASAGLGQGATFRVHLPGTAAAPGPVSA